MLLTVVFLLSAAVSVVFGQACNADTPCPASAPCCSEYGFCGSGPGYCNLGCNPISSHSLDSCAPNPVCKDTTYSFTDKSRILMGADASTFDGNPDKYDWVLDGGNIDVANNNLIMILTESNNGVRLSSIRYIHYGTITTTLKTGRWGGVVSASITMSDIRDEIDWEFPGANTTEGQTNIFWRGTLPNGATHTGLTDTYQNYHDFAIDWQPDALTFKIDGKTIRSIKASDRVQNGVSDYPSTPSRIQLSLWPGGDSSSPGVVAWAGGPVDWKNGDYLAAGNSFRSYVKSVTVKCAEAANGAQSYVYASGSSKTLPNVQLSSKSPLLGGSSTTTTLTSTSTTTTSTSTSSSSMSTSATTTSSSSSNTTTTSTSTSTTSSSTSTTTSSTASSSTASSSSSTSQSTSTGTATSTTVSSTTTSRQSDATTFSTSTSTSTSSQSQTKSSSAAQSSSSTSGSPISSTTSNRTQTGSRSSTSTSSASSQTQSDSNTLIGTTTAVDSQNGQTKTRTNTKTSFSTSASGSGITYSGSSTSMISDSISNNGGSPTDSQTSSGPTSVTDSGSGNGSNNDGGDSQSSSSTTSASSDPNSGQKSDPGSSSTSSTSGSSQSTGSGSRSGSGARSIRSGILPLLSILIVSPFVV